MSWHTGAPPAELDEPELRAALARFVELLGHPGAGVSLLLADDATLRALNRDHRGVDRPTDVLSWSYLDAPAAAADAPALLGELALSLERARAQAAENGWPLRTEVLRLLAHGCAHLAGHDHATPAEDAEMRALEETLLAAVGLTGLYPPREAAGEPPP